MTRSVSREDGNALVTAILVSFMVFTLALSTLQIVDNQQRESRAQRERESTFQLSEGVLNAQIYRLSGSWPGTAGAAFPAECIQGSTTVDKCPTPASLDATYTSVDYAAGMLWTTHVRDNSGAAGSYWSDAALTSTATEPAYTWDQNLDNLVWVRSEGVVHGRRRALVALVKADTVPLNLPKATLVADHFEVTNSGNKTIIDTNGTENQYTTGPIMVRCGAAGSETEESCADFESSKGQVDPPLIDLTTKPAGISADKLDLLRARAEAEGNYHAGCPTSLAGDLPGEVVYIEDAGVGCKFNANAVYNSATQPGVVVVNRGTIEANGNAAFYGLIYHANLDDVSDTVIVLGGGITVYGSVQVAGRGGVYAGSNKVNLVFDPNYIEQIRAFGTAGIVQNSFREIRPGS